MALTLSKGMRVVVTGRLEQRSWETEEGEHRSKVEITADEVGPSLRFATADVQRTERHVPVDLSVIDGVVESGGEPLGTVQAEA